MHLAILLTNTDESEFSQRHPKDGEKFTDLIHLVRPDWTTDVFSVKDGVFPEDLSAFDGVMITGSPASVHNGAAWTDRLLQVIRDLTDQRIPLFGACFGHQAIAVALGGTVGKNPGGWVHGLTWNELVHRPDWARDLPDRYHLFGSHSEQVLSAPEGAIVKSRAAGCPIAGMVIGDHVMTTQHHPEMSSEFIRALTDEMAGDLGPELTARAHLSLASPADQMAFAETLARFFEAAHL